MSFKIATLEDNLSDFLNPMMPSLINYTMVPDNTQKSGVKVLPLPLGYDPTNKPEYELNQVSKVFKTTGAPHITSPAYTDVIPDIKKAGQPNTTAVKVLDAQTLQSTVKGFEELINRFNKEFGFLDDILTGALRAALYLPDVNSRTAILTASKNYIAKFRTDYNLFNKNLAKAKFNASKAFGIEIETRIQKEEVLALKNPAISLEWAITFKNIWNKVLKPAVAVAGVVAGTVLSGGTLAAGLIAAGAGVAAGFASNPNQNIGQALSNISTGNLDIGMPNFAGIPMAESIMNTVTGIKTDISGNPILNTLSGAVGTLAKNVLNKSDVSVSVSGDGYNLNYSKEQGQDATWNAAAGNTPTIGLMGINPIWLIAGGLGLFLILKK